MIRVQKLSPKIVEYVTSSTTDATLPSKLYNFLMPLPIASRAGIIHLCFSSSSLSSSSLFRDRNAQNHQAKDTVTHFESHDQLHNQCDTAAYILIDQFSISCCNFPFYHHGSYHLTLSSMRKFQQ
jgi:hypothetical protein